MSHDRQRALVQRQAELVARSRELRASIAQDAAALERPFARVDNVRSGFRWLAAHPHWVLLGLAAPLLLPLLLRPKKIAGSSLKLFAYWRTWQRARRIANLLRLVSSPGKRWRAK